MCDSVLVSHFAYRSFHSVEQRLASGAADSLEERACQEAELATKCRPTLANMEVFWCANDEEVYISAAELERLCEGGHVFKWLLEGKAGFGPPNERSSLFRRFHISKATVYQLTRAARMTLDMESLLSLSPAVEPLGGFRFIDDLLKKPKTPDEDRDCVYNWWVVHKSNAKAFEDVQKNGYTYAWFNEKKNLFYFRSKKTPLDPVGTESTRIN